MSKSMSNWSETPLLRAGTKVINTPVKTTLEGACEMVFRYDVANIHAIKQFRSLPQQG